MSSECLFCKIINKELSSIVAYEDDKVIAFDDINPQAPIHKLIVPKQHIATVNELSSKHNELLGHMIQVAKNLAKEYNLSEEGYRLVINCNEKGGQAVYHLHLHLLGDRQMHWPPG